MAITKIDEYEVMYSTNMIVPRIWLESTGKFISQLVFSPMVCRCRLTGCRAGRSICIIT